MSGCTSTKVENTFSKKKFKNNLQGKNMIMDPKPNHDHGSETES